MQSIHTYFLLLCRKASLVGRERKRQLFSVRRRVRSGPEIAAVQNVTRPDPFIFCEMTSILIFQISFWTIGTD